MMARQRSAAFVALALFVWLAACSESHVSTDGNTSWLRVCDESVECDEGECLGQVCSRGCDLALPGGCGALGFTAECLPLPASPTIGICDRECAADGDCRAVGADARCAAGRCRQPRQATGAPDQSAAPPGDAGPQDAGPQDATTAAPPDPGGSSGP